MSNSIHASVGEQGKNLPDDVRQIFLLLNNIRIEPLVVSDQCSPELVQAIKDFQKNFLAQPDGRIDVGGTTWEKLIATAGSSNHVNSILPPGGEQDKEFDIEFSTLNLEDNDKYQFEFKTTGTSIGFKVAVGGGRKSGLFLPENSATHLEGEVVSYRLSRLLGVSEIFNPVAYYTLKTNAIRRFKQMLRSDEKSKWRRENTETLLKRIDESPSFMLGIYKYRHKRKSQPVDKLIISNGLNRQHRLAQLIKAEGPMPSKKAITLEKISPDKPEYPTPKESESVLAKQLSIIFTIDMLTGQWDRFSGRNIEVYAHKDGRLQFVARDNGGSHLLWGWNWFNKYRSWLTRFDSDLIQELRLMKAFLDGKSDEYKGIVSTASFADIVGFTNERTFKAFKEKLDIFLSDHVQSCEDRFGKKCYFS